MAKVIGTFYDYEGKHRGVSHRLTLMPREFRSFEVTAEFGGSRVYLTLSTDGARRLRDYLNSIDLEEEREG